MLVLYQNHIINKQNEQYNQKLRKMEIQRDMPQFIFKKIGSSGNYSRLRISIQNISNNSVADVKIFNLTIYDANEKFYTSQNVLVLKTPP